MQYAPIEQGPAIVAGRPRVLPMLEVVAEGARNSSLFDVLRWWSYEQDRGAVQAHWYVAVRDHALHHNERFPEPRKLPSTAAKWRPSGGHWPALRRCWSSVLDEPIPRGCARNLSPPEGLDQIRRRARAGGLVSCPLLRLWIGVQCWERILVVAYLDSVPPSGAACVRIRQPRHR